MHSYSKHPRHYCLHLSVQILRVGRLAFSPAAKLKLVTKSSTVNTSSPRAKESTAFVAPLTLTFCSLILANCAGPSFHFHIHWVLFPPLCHDSRLFVSATRIDTVSRRSWIKVLDDLAPSLAGIWQMTVRGTRVEARIGHCSNSLPTGHRLRNVASLNHHQFEGDSEILSALECK